MSKKLTDFYFNIETKRGSRLIKVRNIKRYTEDITQYSVNIWINNELYDKGMIFVAKNKVELKKYIKEYAEEELNR